MICMFECCPFDICIYIWYLFMWSFESLNVHEESAWCWPFDMFWNLCIWVFKHLNVCEGEMENSFWHLNVLVFANLDTWTYQVNPLISKYIIMNIWTIEYLDIWISAYLNVGTIEYLIVQVTQFAEILSLNLPEIVKMCKQWFAELAVFAAIPHLL